MHESNFAVLQQLLSSCIKKDRRSQELLFKQFYSYSMQVCLRYSENPLQARLILNEGFLKLFAILNTFDNQTSFRIFLGRILISTAIDYLLKQGYLASSPEQLQAEQPVLIDDKALIRITGIELNYNTPENLDSCLNF